MRLTLRLLGTEVIHICTDHSCDPPPNEGEDLAGGTTIANVVGFTASAGDQRWVEAPTPTFED